MSENKYETNAFDSVSDAKVTEHTTIDSGVFMSGENLQLSSANLSQQLPSDIKMKNLVDSGLELSENFSGLILENSNCNNLSRPRSTEQNKEPLVDSPAEPDNDTWKHYFQQDEDGDT